MFANNWKSDSSVFVKPAEKREFFLRFEIIYMFMQTAPSIPKTGTDMNSTVRIKCWLSYLVLNLGSAIGSERRPITSILNPSSTVL